VRTVPRTNFMARAIEISGSPAACRRCTSSYRPRRRTRLSELTCTSEALRGNGPVRLAGTAPPSSGRAGSRRSRPCAPASQRSTAWRRLASRCHRSATWTAAGAPIAMPLAYSVERSRTQRPSGPAPRPACVYAGRRAPPVATRVRRKFGGDRLRYDSRTDARAI